MSSKSSHGSTTQYTASSHSPTSKTHSMDPEFVTHTKPTNVASLNVLFLGETSVGEGSIVDLVAGSVASVHTGRCALSDDTRNVTIDDKKLTLYISSTNKSMSLATREKRVRDILRKSGGVHLLVYCMDASHSPEWVHEVHHTISSNSTPSLHIPAVAVIVGISDAPQQELWWSSTRDSLANQGPHFNDHAFISVARDAQSLAGDHISEGCHALRVLICQNAKPETSSDFQRAAFYNQRTIGNSLQSLLMLSRKSSSRASVGSKPVNIVLLGEIGVGKSSLINLIAQANVAAVSSDTIGCTTTVDKYTFEEKGKIFYLYDTPGLVDPQMGDKPFIDPIDAIQQLIQSLGDGIGPDLVLLCIDNSRPTTSFKRNYRIFHDFICSSKVPFALAVTKLEGIQGADQWWSNHGASIRRFGVDRSRYIGLARDKGRLDSNADAEGRLRESLLSFLATCINQQKNSAISLRSSVGWVTSFLRSRASTPERTLMKECELEEQTARKLADRIAFSKIQWRSSR